MNDICISTMSPSWKVWGPVSLKLLSESLSYAALRLDVESTYLALPMLSLHISK